jgi:hypothetical protein
MADPRAGQALRTSISPATRTAAVRAGGGAAVPARLCRQPQPRRDLPRRHASRHRGNCAPGSMRSPLDPRILVRPLRRSLRRHRGAAAREGFTIVECNGAGAEATHIWDARVRLLDAYRTLFRQFALLWKIGARNREPRPQARKLDPVPGTMAARKDDQRPLSADRVMKAGVTRANWRTHPAFGLGVSEPGKLPARGRGRGSRRFVAALRKRFSTFPSSASRRRMGR